MGRFRGEGHSGPGCEAGECDLVEEDNIVRRNCTDARMNVVRHPTWGLHINIQNKHLLSTRAAGITLRAQSISLQASLTLLSYK